MKETRASLWGYVRMRTNQGSPAHKGYTPMAEVHPQSHTHTHTQKNDLEFKILGNFHLVLNGKWHQQLYDLKEY